MEWCTAKVYARSVLTVLVLLLCLDGPDAQGERRRRVFGRQVPIRGSSRVVNNGNGNTQDIPGFSSLATIGNNANNLNNLLERDPRNPFVFRRIQSNGFLQPLQAETGRQLEQFLLTNFANLNGNNQRLASDFLRRRGGAVGNAILGRAVNFDVEPGRLAFPKKGFEHLRGREKQVTVAALNFLLNTISSSSTVLGVSPRRVAANGLVGLSLGRFVRSDGLALMLSDNPYDCAKNGRAPIRLDWAIERAMNPDVYYAVTGTPKTLKEFSAVLGTQDDKRRTVGNKIVIAGKDNTPEKMETIVGMHPQRLLEFQGTRNIPGGTLYTSYDSIYNPPPGVQTESRDIFKNGINATHDAGESIYLRKNGFMGFFLNNAAGARANSAPVEIARNSVGEALDQQGFVPSDVTSPVSCLVCHKTGFLGGSISKKTDNAYTDNFGKVPSFHRRFFTNNATYAARARRDSIVNQNALKRAGAWVPSGATGKAATEPKALLPEFVGAYRAPLTMTDAARELGAPTDAVAGLFRTNAEGKIARADFAQGYCSAKNRLVAAGQGGGFQRPITSVAQGAGGARAEQHNATVSADRPVAQ